MAWIESHQGLARHIKTKRLARRLGVTIPAAIGHLHLLWWWAMDNIIDGDLSSVDCEDIAEEMLWNDDPQMLMDALVYSGFVDNTEKGLFIHDWHDYVGRLLEKRKKETERKREYRKKSSSRPTGQDAYDTKYGGGNSTVPYSTVQNQQLQEGGVIENPFKLFESEGYGTISSTVRDDLNDMIDTYGERWTCEAMKEAVRQGKRKLSYVIGILKRWKADGIDDPLDKGKVVQMPQTDPDELKRQHVKAVMEAQNKTYEPREIPWSS
jgi:DnaD/phage-associated family protein